mgnify:CR=1 FL=1
MTALEIKDLNKTFGEREVLRGVNLRVEGGEILTLIGASGGGKTTLLRCLNFLEIPDSGEIRIYDTPVFSRRAGERAMCDAAAQRRVGLVFQEFQLFPQYSVLDNLTLAPKLTQRRSTKNLKERKRLFEATDARARELLAAMGLAGREGAYPYELSGGQRQRVAIARALMPDPEILCFDEPTSALDPELTGEVLRVIRSLRSPTRAMIVVTHELSFARAVSDRVVFMAEGKIEEEGTPGEVFDTPKSDKTRAFLSSGIADL